MSLGNPLALWLLLLVPIPLLLSKRSVARRFDVANLYLWTSVADPNASLRLRSMRRNWIVILQMAIIAALAFAIARPALPVRAERVAFVFDLSASMLAHDGGGTRFDSAGERARAALARLPRRTRVRVIGAGTTARDFGEYSASDGALQDAIAHLRPAAGTADIAGALLKATASSPADRVVVFSDHSSDVESPDRRVPIQWEAVGTPTDNVAISKLVARRQPLAPSDADVIVVVRNYGLRQVRADVQILRDGTQVERRSMDIDANREETLLLTIAHVRQVVTARLAADDGLSVDNERSDVLPTLDQIRVSETGRTNFFVERALTADRRLAVERSANGVADVVVCGCDQLASVGNVLLVPEKPTGVEIGALTDDDVRVSVGSHRAFVASERGNRRIVELRFVPEPENGISTAFPILVANAIRWLDGRSDNLTQVIAGEPLQWRVGDVQQLAVSGPDGRPRTAQLAAGTMIIVDTASVGVYSVRTPTSERLFAVNAAIDGESDLRTTGAQSTASPQSTHRSSDDFALMRLLLLVAAVLVGIEWFIQRQNIVWRAAVAICALVGAAGFAVVPHAANVDVVAALDRSRSVPVRTQQQAMERLAANVQTLRRGDRLGILDFGANALVQSELAEAAEPRPTVSAVADADTDIAAGLRLARAMLPTQGSRRIVLFSDGRQTTGDAEREAAFVAADGIHVDVAGLRASSVSSTPAIARVIAPSSARSSEPFDVRVELVGSKDADAELTLFADDRPLDSRQIRLASPGSSTQTFTDRQVPGIHVYRAILKTDDGGEDASGAVVSVAGAPSTLYVARSSGALEPVLSGAGFEVTRVAPGALPPGVEALRRYDAVVLDDVTADEVGDEHASDISRYVEQFGGGLLLLGSSRTLDIAGYPTGPLASSLPIDLRRRSGQRSPAFGLVIVFDKSGSMADQAGGVSKIELARQAVMRVLGVLPPTDSLGVIAFDSKPVVVSRLSAGQRGQDIATELQGILPGGATRIASAASLAVQWLNDASTRAALSKRRVLLISDGQTTTDDERELRAAVASSGVEVSTVAVGVNSNRALLEQLAASTGGQSYFPTDLSELPKIVAREAVRSRSGSTVEEPFVPRASTHPILAGFDRESFPQLSGYVVAAAKPSAASVLTSHLDDPVLCAWQFGLGRVAVFTADVRGAWSASLRAWPSFGRLWVQSARWVSRGLDDRDLRLTFRRDGNTLLATVESEREDGGPLELVDARATVRMPDGRSSDIAFEPSAPSRYAARVDASAGGAFVFAFTGRERGGAEHHVTGGVFRDADDERAALGADDGLLARIAAITGGRVLAMPDNPFAFPRPMTYRDITTWIVAIALGLYVANLLVAGRLPFAHSVVSAFRRTSHVTSSAT